MQHIILYNIDIMTCAGPAYVLYNQLVCVRILECNRINLTCRSSEEILAIIWIDINLYDIRIRL